MNQIVRRLAGDLTMRDFRRTHAFKVGALLGIGLITFTPNVSERRAMARTPLQQATPVEQQGIGVTTHKDHTTLNPVLVGIEPSWNCAVWLSVDTPAIDEATLNRPSTKVELVVTVIGDDLHWCRYVELSGAWLVQDIEGTKLQRPRIDGPLESMTFGFEFAGTDVGRFAESKPLVLKAGSEQIEFSQSVRDGFRQLQAVLHSRPSAIRPPN